MCAKNRKDRPKPALQKILLTLLAAMIVMSIFPMQTRAEESEPRRVLRVGFEGMTVPCAWTQGDDSNGAVPITGSNRFLAGFEVEYMKRVCALAGYQLEAYQYDWDGLMMAVSAGKIDCAVAMISPTDDRRQTMDFTDPYYYADTVAVVRKDGPYAGAQSLQELAGARATSMLNTLWYTQQVDRIPRVDKKPAMENVPTLVVALQSDKADVIVLDRPTAEGVTAANGDLCIAPLREGFSDSAEQTAVAIALTRGSDALMAELNGAIARIGPEELQQMIDDACLHQPLDQSETGIAAMGFFPMVGLLLREYGLIFLQGAAIALLLALFGTFFGTLIGCGAGAVEAFPMDGEAPLLKRAVHRTVRQVISSYVWLFRGTPMMVQAMVIYYGGAQLFGWDMNPLWAGLFIISVNTGAYMTETVRGGILSVDRGQLEGAKAIGMSSFQSMFRVILPQGFQSILPQIGNYFISNIKDTSLLSVITVGELFYRAREAAGQYFRFFEVFLIVSVIYLFLTTVVTFLLNRIEKKAFTTAHDQVKENP